MREQHKDSVDAALESLANERELELPDPRIERRLLAIASTQGAADSARGPRLSLRAAGALLFLFLLAGGTFAASVGLEGLKRWWYSIQIGGEELSGEVQGDGSRRVTFETEDGYSVRVLVDREQLPGDAQQTRIEVIEEGQGEQTLTAYEVIHGPSSASHERGARLSSALLADSEALHTWTDVQGAGRELHLIDAPADDPSGQAGQAVWLVVHELDTSPEFAVLLVQRLARPIGEEGWIEVLERADGAVEVELDDGHGWAIALMLPGTLPGSDADADAAVRHEVTTPSGRVHVELGDD